MAFLLSCWVEARPAWVEARTTIHDISLTIVRREGERSDMLEEVWDEARAYGVCEHCLCEAGERAHTMRRAYLMEFTQTGLTLADFLPNGAEFTPTFNRLVSMVQMAEERWGAEPRRATGTNASSRPA